MHNIEKNHEDLKVWTEFCQELKYENRFFINHDILSVFEKVIEKHKEKLRAGKFLYRARVGGIKEFDEEEIQFRDQHQKLYPYPASEMGMPPREKTSEARGNPVGITYLYTATDIKTAIAEVRPWVSDKVSVVTIRLKKGLTIANVTYTSAFNHLDPLLHRYAVALSKPVKPDRYIEYVPAQYITEMVKKLGYDGIRYTSSVGNGDNVLLFTEDNLNFTDTKLYRIDQIKYNCPKIR